MFLSLLTILLSCKLVYGRTIDSSIAILYATEYRVMMFIRLINALPHHLSQAIQTVAELIWVFGRDIRTYNANEISRLALLLSRSYKGPIYSVKLFF